MTGRATELQFDGDDDIRRFDAAGVGHSGRSDLPERVEEILRADWDR
ncbi:hypothetical protein ACIHDR_35775 [Nocardia sp. NPDC052278]